MENMNHERRKLTCIDLLCGCSGFTLGMQRADYSVLAAIDLNAEAIATFDHHFPDVPFIPQEDLTTFGPQDLAKLVQPTAGPLKVDVLIGGPP
jgi:DNA (cytosine-5)-methyltransferase 1